MPDTVTITEALATLKAGNLLAIPTETVYGLAADARNPAAVAKIFALKNRPMDHPLIVHIAGVDQLQEWAVEIPEICLKLAHAFWPGPLTFILKKRDEVSDAITGGQATIGLRCPNNPLSLQLLQQFHGGLAAPSANRFGRLSPTNAQHVRDEFGTQSPLILDGGPCRVGIESTIIDLSQSPARILRPGAISFEQLRAFLPDLVQGAQLKSPRVSGALDAHYAPLTPMQIVSREDITQCADSQHTVALCLETLPDGIRGIALPKQAEHYAAQLYASLRTLDAYGAQRIVLEAFPNGPEWAAVADRVKRAVSGSGP